MTNGSGSHQQGSVGRRRSAAAAKTVRLQSHLIALEPRMMFDGAAVATTATVMVPGDAATIDPALRDTMFANGFGLDRFATVSDNTLLQDGAPSIEISRLGPAPALSGMANPSGASDRTGIERSTDSDPLIVEDRAMPGEIDRLLPRQDEFGLSADERDRLPFDNEAAGGDPVEVAPAVSPPANVFVFIDTNVTGYQQLADEWAGRGTVVLIDAARDGIDQVRTALAGAGNIDAIHIVSHGGEGYFDLGTTRIDQSAVMGELASSWAAIGSRLNAGGDILLYGCDVGAGDAGQRLVDSLALTTGADIAASIDDTGSVLRGGDWTLENRLGAIDNASLVSRTWEGLLAPTPLSAPANSLTLRNAAGVAVTFSNGVATQAVGTGAVARWANVGTVNGVAVDLVATVVSITGTDTLTFNQPGSNGTGVDDFGFVLNTSGNSGTASAQIRWDLVRTGTGTAVIADVTFTVADIDGVGGNTLTRESVVVSTDTLSSYQSAATTDIRFINAAGSITASGTQNETDNPPTAISAARFNWLNTNSFAITYNLNRAGATAAGFSHDGDLDFNLGTGGVTVSIPRLDLDGNDSTTTGSGYFNTFTENGAAVSIVDSDVTITNPAGTVQNATVTITNVQAGDELLVNGSTAASGNVGGIAYTRTAGGVVNFTTAGTAAQYTAALQAITFRNTSDAPVTTDRLITVGFANTALNSNVATSTIRVVDINDTPTIAAPASYSGTEDTVLTLNGLTMTDIDAGNGSVQLTVSIPAGVGVLNFAATPFITVVNNGTGTVTLQGQRAAIVNAVNGGALTLTPTLNYNGTSTVTYIFNDRGNTGRDPGLTGDATSEEASTTATISFAAVNDPAVIGNEVRTMPENSGPITVNVLANDSDVDGPLTVSAVSAPNGVATINPDGTVSYTPNPGFSGTETVTYTLRDPNGGTATGTITVTVTPFDEAPILHLTNDPGFGTNIGSVIWTSNSPTGTRDGTILRTDLVGSAAPLSGGPGVTVAPTSYAPSAQVVTGAATTSLTAAINANDFVQTQFTTAAGLPADTAITQFAQTIINNNQQANDAYPFQIAILISRDPAFTNYDVLVRDRAVTVTPGGGQFQGIAFNADAPYELDASTTYYVRTYIYNVTSVSGLAIFDDFAVRLTGTDDTFENTFIEGGPGVAIASVGLSSLTDIDDTNMESARITITNPQAGDRLEVAGSLPGGITASYDAATATLTLSGSASEADYRTAINAIRFNNGSDDPSTVNRTISAVVNDGERDSQPSASLIRVIPVNDAPVPVGTLPPRSNVDAATSINVPTAAGFTDVDNTMLAYSASGLPAGLSIDGTTGIITGTLARDASQGGSGGVYSVTVTARDAGGLTATQTFSWTVTNPPPVATNDTATTNEDTPVLIAVLPNDSDPDGDPLTVISAAATVGTATVVGNRVQYAPPANFNGTATITYTISDGNGGTATATVTVTVAPVNDAPVATPIPPRSTTDGASISVPVATSFSDVDGDALSFSAAGLPPGLSINPVTGVISGTITASASQTNGGVYTATVTASDGRGGTVSQSITFNVTNPPPVAVNDNASTSEDTAVTISPLANDRDPDGDPLTITAASAPNGIVTINANGTVTYTPRANFNGTDTITYTISDGNGGTSTATITVAVADVNDVPLRSGSIGNQTNLDSQIVSLPVAGAFSDPDRDALTYTATGLPAGLTIDRTTGIIGGTIDRSASQTAGGVYAITVTASDGRGGSVTQTFSWTVTNPAPVAANDTVTTNEDTPIGIDVLANDVDPDGDPLTVTTANAGSGTVVILPNGRLQYTPNSNFNGQDTIVYTITDREGGVSTATVTVNVTPANDAPTTTGLPNQNGDDGTNVSIPTAPAFSDIDGDALTFSATGLPNNLSIDPATGLITGVLAPDTSQNGPYVVTVTATDPSGRSVTTSFVYSVQNVPPIAVNDVAATPEDVPVTVAVLTNDSDPDRDPLTITSASANNGTVVVNANGTLTFTPAPDFNGVATVAYTISDGNGGVATATLTITVGAVNDRPDSVPIPNVTNQDNQAVSVNTGDFFSDRDGDVLAFSVTGLPAGLGIDPATGIISGTIDRSASQPNGGVYTVTVTARDPGGLTVSRTFTWTVTNPAPTAVNDSATTPEDTPIAAINVLGNDTDPDGDALRVTAATATNGTVTINPDGTLRYVPNANFNGTDAIVYVISDGNGGQSTAAVTITVTPVNDAPVAVNDNATTVEDAPVTIGVLGNDRDVDGDRLTVTGATSPNGTVVVNPDGTITFTPAPNFNGPATITYTISDGNGGVSTATVNVTVTPVNDAPIANASNAATNEDAPVVIPVLANDSDVDGNPLTVTAATALNGTVVINPDGTVTYTPRADFNGTDTITYTISDGQGGFATSTVTVTVNAVNDAPVATPITLQTDNDSEAVSLSVAGNFSDPDGNALAFTAAGLPPGLSISAAGIVTGTIDRAASQGGPNADGIYRVTVTASDGNGGTVSQTFSWTVANPSPAAADDAATTNEDTTVIIPILANDADPDGDLLTVTSAAAPNGTVVINANGTLTYTPNANFNGTDTISYTISDGNGGTATAIVTVTVVSVNDAPTVSAPLPSQSGVDGAPVTIPIAGNFSDLDRDTLSFTATGLPPGLTLSAGGVITGSIDRAASQGGPAANGVYTVAVTASDGRGGTVTSSFVYTITNPAPVAANDVATTIEDTPVTVAVLANDTDPDGDPLTVTAATSPNGTVVINANGTITFTPAPNFNGPTTISYTISDSNGGTATATVNLTVTPANDAPVVDTPIANQAGVDGTVVRIPVAANFSDLDRDTLAYSATGLPAGLGIDPATGVIGGTIDSSASQTNGGVYTVTVTASDGAGGSVSTSFTYRVTNPVPTAVNDSATTSEDTPVTIAVLANDTDPDGDPLTVTAATSPDGSVTINANGTITFTPNPNFNGPTTITYTISDGQGGTATATVAINVTAVNDAPTTVGLPNLFDIDSAAVSVPIASAFTDLDGNSLTFSDGGTLAALGLTIDPVTGVISGTIPANASTANGGIYTITITASDGQGGTATTSFTWTISNIAPDAVDDNANTAEDTAITFNVLANDTDPDNDPLRVVSASATNGSVAVNTDGTLTYTPTANFNGTATVTYLITDSNGGFSTATATIIVAPANDAPTAIALPARSNVDATALTGLSVIDVSTSFDDLDRDTLTFTASGLPPGLTIDAAGVISGTIAPGASQGGAGGVYTVTITASDGNGGSVSTSFAWTITNPPPVAANDLANTIEDTPVAIPVLANDADPDGDPLTVTAASAGNGSVAIGPGGVLTYTSEANFNGTDTITYTVSDGNGGTSTATVTVTVSAVNDAPVSTPIAPRSNPDGAVVDLPLRANFADIDNATLAFSATGLPAGLTIDPASGRITGTIDRNASQPNGGVYSVTVTATDAGGLATSQTFAWTVINPPPVAVADSATTAEDVAVNIAVLPNDSDPDGDPLTVTLASAGNGTVVIRPDGTIDYAPNANFNGTDTITYTISDGNGGTATATVTVVVSPVNDPPVAMNDATSTGEDTPVTIAVLANDRDIDGNPLTVTAATSPDGTVVINTDGTITFRPNPDFNGVATITYTISDGQGGTATASATVVVNPVNDPPVATNDSATTSEDAPVTVAVLANDSDVDGDALTITTATSPDGQVTINPNGTITFTPNPNFNGPTTISYTISDGNGGTSTATVTLSVAAVNDPPVANPSSAVTNEDIPATLTPLANDTDLDGNPLTVTAASAANGTVTINADGTLRYVPNANFNGTDTVTYTISDGQGGTATSTITVTVNPVNDLPVAGNDSATTPEDAPVTIAVLANDTDADGNPLAVTAATSPNGTVVINPDGTITFTPNPNFNGPTTITYTISDGQGGTTTATVAVTVTPVNDPPVARPDSATTPEDTPVVIAPLGNDSDLDGNPLTITGATSPNGTVTINPDGTVTFTPNADFNGPTTITYTISDGQGGTTTATIAVTVTPVNDPPVARNDVFTMDEDTTARIPVLANDTDTDGDPLTVTAASSPDGIVVINADGTIGFTPTRDFVGPATITYTISDGRGGTSTATVTVNVVNTNEAPVDGNEAIVTIGGVITPIDVLANATDPERDLLSVFFAEVESGEGTVVINSDGTISYTAPFGFQGIAIIRYIVSDGRGGFDISFVTVNVTQAGADINALLGRRDPFGIDDRARIDGIRDQTGTFIDVPLIVDRTANDFRTLSPIPSLFGERPLLTAVNGFSWLRGMGDLDVGGHPIGDVVDYIDRIRDIRFGADRLLDPRFGDFMVESLTGFSVRELNTGNDQIMIESVVRDRVIYMEVRDVGKDGDPRIVEYQLLVRGGGALPEWIHMDQRGLAIIERPADAEEIHLIVRAIRADGVVIEVPVVIQGATGEIQLDGKVKETARVGALPLGETMALAGSASADEAAKLLAAFRV